MAEGWTGVTSDFGVISADSCTFQVDLARAVGKRVVQESLVYVVEVEFGHLINSDVESLHRSQGVVGVIILVSFDMFQIDGDREDMYEPATGTDKVYVFDVGRRFEKRVGADPDTGFVI